MNTVSKIHQDFSRRLNNPRVLTTPEEFLGPNFEAVLNFWLIIEELSKDQWRVINERHEAFYDENPSEWRKARDLAFDASNEVIDVNYAYHAGWAAEDVTKSGAAYWATLELIGIHKILEDHQQPLTFFPMFLEVL